MNTACLYIFIHVAIKYINLFSGAGVDNHQKVILEIYDGDILGTRSGYCLETVEVYVVDLLRPKTEFPIVIDNDLWGSLIVETIYSVHEYDEQVVHIEKVMRHTHTVTVTRGYFLQ